MPAAAAAAPADEPAAPIAVSLRSRGLTVLDSRRVSRKGCGAAFATEANNQLASLFCALIAAFVTLPLWAWFSALLTSLTAVFFVASQSAALTDGLVVAFNVAAAGLVLYLAAVAVARRDRAAWLLGQGGVVALEGVLGCVLGGKSGRGSLWGYSLTFYSR